MSEIKQNNNGNNTFNSDLFISKLKQLSESYKRGVNLPGNTGSDNAYLNSVATSLGLIIEAVKYAENGICECCGQKVNN